MGKTHADVLQGYLIQQFVNVHRSCSEVVIARYVRALPSVFIVAPSWCGLGPRCRSLARNMIDGRIHWHESQFMGVQVSALHWFQCTTY
jgi:hypothetical protein